MQCHDYCCNVDGYDRHLCIKEDSSCGTGNWDYCPAPRAQDGCRCKQTWSTSGTDCQDYCCTVEGYEPHLCFKEDPDCGSNSWDYCLPPRTEDGCKCSKDWTTNGVTCNNYCCYLEGMEPQHLCIKEDASCGTNHWGYCTSQEALSSRRLSTCEEVQSFCNQNACEHGQPDCHRCGFCDDFGTTVASTLSTTSAASSPATSVGSVTTSTASLSSGSNTYDLGTLWRGRIWDDDGSCSAFSADLVLQLVQFDDFGHGDGILYFMGATNPVALGSCSVTMFYIANVRGSLPYSTLSPQSDVDFFGECEGFSLPYGWVVQIDSQRINGVDSMSCMHIDLQAVASGDMLSDPATTTATTAETSAVPETSANPATTTLSGMGPSTNPSTSSTSAISTAVQTSSATQTSTDPSTASASATSTGVQTSSATQTSTDPSTASASATSTGVQTSSAMHTGAGCRSAGS